MKWLLIIIVVAVVVLLLLKVLRGGAASPSAPSTRDLDEETAARPEIDAAALASARAAVSTNVPDAVLQDVLLDATPTQVARMFANVPTEVMAGAIGSDSDRGGTVKVQGQAKAEDLAKLRQMSTSVDDLEIWNFGDDSVKH